MTPRSVLRRAIPGRGARAYGALALLLGALTGCDLIPGIGGDTAAADSVLVDSTGAVDAVGVVGPAEGADGSSLGPPVVVNADIATGDSGAAEADPLLGPPAPAVVDSGAGGNATAAAGTGATPPAGGTATPPAGQAAPAQNTQDQSSQGQGTQDRLDQILAGQQRLERRIDSLAAVGMAAQDSAGVASGQEIIGEARQRVQNFGMGIAWSIIVLVLVNLTVRGSVWLLDTLAESNASRRLFYKRLVPIVRIILWAFAAYFVVSVIFRVQPQQLFAAAAAIGVAIGFAAQDLLKNLFGGIILVFDQPFQVGDKISVGGTYGEVVSIGLRSTRIVTPDDNLVSVPNAQVVDQQVANANAGELNCQVVTDLYLPGWADEVLAKRIAFGAAASSKYVYLNKPIVTLVSDVFKETFLTRVRVKAYVLDPRLEFAFQSDVTERAREGFRDAGLLEPEHVERRFLDHAAPAVLRRQQEAQAAAASAAAPTARADVEGAGQAEGQADDRRSSEESNHGS